MNKILFICSGNVGRSQMAEAFYNKFTSDKNSISAGIDPLTPKKYLKLPQIVIDVMNEEGIDISMNQVKYLTQEMVDGVGQIIVMCDKKMCPMFLQNSKKVIYWKINDPYNTSIDNFRIIRDQIKNKVLKLIAN